MPFLSPLEVRAVGRNKWRLLSELAYRHGRVTYTVPVGFVTDLASIPRVARTLLPQNDRHREAATVHDYLYAVQPVSRKHADLVFLDAMRELGVGWLKRHTMYQAVRTGGWVAWRKHRRAPAPS